MEYPLPTGDPKTLTNDESLRPSFEIQKFAEWRFPFVLIPV